MKEDIIKEVIKNFREKCRLGEPIGRWEKEMEFTVKLTLALQKKELLEKIEKMKKKTDSYEYKADSSFRISVDNHNQALEDIKKLLT